MATELASPIPNPVQNALANLEAEKALATNCTQLLTNLADHFSYLDRTLSKRSQSLDSKLDALDADKLHSLQALDLREASLPDRESAAAAQITDGANSAVSEMENPDSKLPEDLKGLLRLYCQRMDSAGLWRFLLSRRKDLAALRKEVPDAVAGSVDSVRLVLDAVEDFLSEHCGDFAAAASGGSGDPCWALGMLLRSLFDREGKKPPEVSTSIAERAAVVAEGLKARFDEKGKGEGGGVGGPEAQMFLQLVVAFGLSLRFEHLFLRKLVVEHASRKEMSKLAVGLGFGEKLADIIDDLVMTDKVIEAVYFAHESGLEEQFSPVPLLRSYLQRSKKTVYDILKNGNHSTAATEEATTLELSVVRSIIYCVEALKLERDFSLVGLRKRLVLLERAKADRKLANKYENRRARIAAAGPSSRPTKSARTSNVPYASSHRNLPPTRHSFKYPAQVGFDSPASSAFGAASHSRSPAAVPPQYYEAQAMAGLQTTMPYGGATAGYGGYDYAAPAQLTYPQQH